MYNYYSEFNWFYRDVIFSAFTFIPEISGIEGIFGITIPFILFSNSFILFIISVSVVLYNLGLIYESNLLISLISFIILSISISLYLPYLSCSLAKA